MTEAEWLTATDLTPMLTFLRDKASDRKLRLFAVGCCRSIWGRFSEPNRRVIDIAEKYCDGVVGEAELEQVRDEVHREQTPVTLDFGTGYFHSAAEFTVDEPAYFVAFQVQAQLDGCVDHTTGKAVRADELLRDIFGNPFHPVTVAPSWLSSTAFALAEGIYQDRAFDRLPILADALEDSGCDNEDILNHCRGDGPHVRGCWVVDLVLGKH